MRERCVYSAQISLHRSRIPYCLLQGEDIEYGMCSDEMKRVLNGIPRSCTGLTGEGRERVRVDFLGVRVVVVITAIDCVLRATCVSRTCEESWRYQMKAIQKTHIGGGLLRLLDCCYICLLDLTICLVIMNKGSRL